MVAKIKRCLLISLNILDFIMCSCVRFFFFFFFPHKDGKNMVSFKLQNGSDHLEHFKSKLQHSEVEM